MTINIGELKEPVSIIGVGCTPFGSVLETPEIKDMTERELFAWASLEAMEDAGIESKDIDAFYVAQSMGETLSHTYGTAASMADWIGMRKKPGFHHEATCSSTNAGLMQAILAVASGLFKVVLSGGVEITSSRPKEGKPAHMREAMDPGDLRYHIQFSADQAYYYPTGVTGPAELDSVAMSYGRKFGLTYQQLEDTLNAAAMNNRRNGIRNPLATVYKDDFMGESKKRGFKDVKDYMKSKFNPRIGAIARLHHLAMTVDGASALIVCPSKMARTFTEHPIEVIGFGSAVSIYYHETTIPWEVEQELLTRVYKMARIDPYRDVNYMYVNDSLIGMQFASGETAGYFRPGEGWRAILEGRTCFDGDKPLSTTGGRTTMGNAPAAAAGAEITEAVRQMRGLCDTRQIKPSPEVSVVYNRGQGVHCNVSILRKNF